MAMLVLENLSVERIIAEQNYAGIFGHEHPYSIKMSHIRDSLKADGPETPVILDKDLNDNSINCQFILRETKKVPNKINIDENQRKKSKIKKSPLSFFKKRHRDPSPSAAPTGKLFGHPLAQVFTDDNDMPKPIYDMLYYLFMHGPFTAGIFRKPANQKAVKDLREKLDTTDDYSLEDINPLVVASTLKEYLRSLPDCLLLHDLYPLWLASVDMDNLNECIKALEHVSERLPSKNSILLRHLMCMLYHIHQRAEENSMTSYNLAVCISQSLLWTNNITDSTADLTQQSDAMEKVPKLIQVMVDNCIEIFGKDTIKLFGDPITAKQRGDSSTDSDSMNSILSVNCYNNGNNRRDDSSIDSLERYSYGEIDPSTGLMKTQHLSPTNISRDSGLFSSDTQLYEESCGGQESDNASGSAKPNSEQPQLLLRAASHDPDNKQQQKQLRMNTAGPLSHSYDSEMDSMNMGQESTSNILGSAYLPKLSPRKIKRKSEPQTKSDLLTVDINHKVGTGSNYPMPTVHSGVELRTMQLMEVDPQTVTTKDLRRPIPGRSMPKRSTDSALGSSLGSSLGSVEESSETSHDEFHEMQNRYGRDMGTIRKSESGAKLYLDESLLHSGMSNTDSIQEEGTCSTSSSGNISQKQAINHSKVSRVYSSSPPRTRHNWGGVPDKAGSSKSSKTKSKFSLSPADSLDEETEDEVLRSINDHDSAVSTKTNTNQLSPRLEPIKSHQKPQESIKTVRNKPTPQLKDLKSQSLDSHGYEMYLSSSQSTLGNVNTNSGRIKYSPRDMNNGQSNRQRKGMTSKGSDLFPTQDRQKLVGPQNVKVVPNLSSSPRSQTASKTVDYGGHIPRSAQLVRQVAVHDKGLERSSSDTRVIQHFFEKNPNVSDESRRPVNPPSYQEAMRRKSSMNVPSKSSSNILLSEDQVTKQKQTSARARQLYEESQRLYSEENKQQKDCAYYSEPELADDSRDSTPVRGENTNTSSTLKSPPSYEVACMRSEQIKTRRSLQTLPTYYDSHRADRITGVTTVSGSNHELLENSPIKKVISSKNRDSNLMYNSNTSIIDDREKTPTPENCNVNSASNNISSNGKEGRKRNKSRERREGQRLSDTRLENNRRKKKGTSLSRSKSDSSEHLHKLSKLGLRVQDSTDSEDEWPVMYRNRRIAKSVERHASKERINSGFDIHKRPKSVDAATLLRHMRESGLDELEPNRSGNTMHNRHTIRRNTTVKNKDWHKELAETYNRSIGKSGSSSKMFYQPGDEHGRFQSKIIFKYNRSLSPEGSLEPSLDESGEPTVTKRRWMPPVHPTKDLVVLRSSENAKDNAKDYSLNRSSSNVADSSVKRPPFLTRQMRSNTVEHIAVSGIHNNTSAQQQVPMQHNKYRAGEHVSTRGQQSQQSSNSSFVINRNPNYHPYHSSNIHSSHNHNVQEQYSHSDSPLTTNSEQEDSDNETEQGGLTWSVSKLRNLWDNPSSSALEQTSSASPISSSSSSCASKVSSTNSNKSSSGTASQSSHFYSPNSQPPNHNVVRNSGKDSPSSDSQTLVSSGKKAEITLGPSGQRLRRIFGNDTHTKPNTGEQYV